MSELGYSSAFDNEVSVLKWVTRLKSRATRSNTAYIPFPFDTTLGLSLRKVLFGVNGSHTSSCTTVDNWRRLKTLPRLLLPLEIIICELNFCNLQSLPKTKKNSRWSFSGDRTHSWFCCVLLLMIDNKKKVYPRTHIYIQRKFVTKRHERENSRPPSNSRPCGRYC